MLQDLSKTAEIIGDMDLHVLSIRFRYPLNREGLCDIEEVVVEVGGRRGRGHDCVRDLSWLRWSE